MHYTWGYIKDATLAKLDMTEKEALSQKLFDRFPIYANEVITQVCSTIKPKHTFAEFIITKSNLFDTVVMPSDFISFGDDVNTVIYTDENNNNILKECHDDDFIYKGYNQLQFFKEGKYSISYNARWLMFNKNMDDSENLDIPMDILECIPSYIAHQCYKIDDEIKASIYRNEYEMFFARIDDTYFKQTKTFKIAGDW